MRATLKSWQGFLAHQGCDHTGLVHNGKRTTNPHWNDLPEAFLEIVCAKKGHNTFFSVDVPSILGVVDSWTGPTGRKLPNIF